MATDFTQPPDTTSPAQAAALQQQQQAQAQANSNTIQVLPGKTVDPAALAQAQAAANAAAAQNAAWKSNTLPVLPQYAAGGGAHYTQAEIEDATREAAKHAAAFHPEDYYGFKYADLANVPLSQIAARYGTNAADLVQGYYTQHPSQQFLDIQQQYNQQHQITVNPFNPESAAGIAWEVNRTGGSIGVTLGGKSYAEGYNPVVNMSVEQSTVPLRDLSSGWVSGGKTVAGFNQEGVTVYTPYGSYVQEKVENAKILLDFNTGEIAIYQQPAGHSIWNLVGGGGRAAVQSGMFTINEPQTPYVMKQFEAGSYQMPATKNMSRLGAEAYGGYVTDLTGKLLTPETRMSTYANENNLATMVNWQGANLGKAEAPGAKIPWSIEPGSPSIQYMNEQGIIPGAVAIPGHLVSGGMIGGVAVTTTNLMQEKSDIVSTVLRPSDFSLEALRIFGGGSFGAALTGVGDFIFGTSTEVTREHVTNLQSTTSMNVPVQTITAVPGGYEITTTTPYTTTGGRTIERTITSTPNLSGFAYGESQFAKQVTVPVIPQLTYRETGILSLNYLEAGGIGLVQGIREKPLTAAIYAGAGAVMVLGGEAIAGLGAATIAATEGTALAPVAIATNWFATAAAPVVLTGLYGADVIGRTTQWGKDLSPAAAQRLGVITSTEILPMLIGSGAVAYRGEIMSGITDAYASIRYGTSPTAPALNEPFNNPVYQGHVEEMSGRSIALTEHLTRGDLMENLEGFNKFMGFGRTEPVGGNIGGISSEVPAVTYRLPDLSVTPAEPYHVATPTEIFAQIQPIQRVATQDELQAFLAPRSRAMDVTEITGFGQKVPGAYDATSTMFGQEVPGAASATTAKMLGARPWTPEPTPTAWKDLFFSQKSDYQMFKDMIYGGPLRLSAGGAWEPGTTSLATVPFTRTSLGSAYDITRTNLQYSPDVQSVIIEASRDIITPGNYGKVVAAQKSSAITVDVGEYARATGIDLVQGSRAAAGFVDVYKIESIRDVYPSGMVYENVIGRKGTVEIAGRESAGQISSRGIAYGQGTIERNAMAQADEILNIAIAKRAIPSRISSTDLPTIIKDLASGYGSINVESAYPIAASVDVATVSTRIVRATTPFEQIFGEHAIRTAEAGAKLGVNIPGGAKGEQLSSLFETLPNYGVIGSEVISSYKGTPLVPVVSGGYVFDVNAGVKDILFGERAAAFESEAMQLHEHAGIEKVRRPYDIKRQPITPLSRTFGKQKPSVKPADIGSGPLKQIAAVSGEFVKAETERIGRGIETILGKVQKQSVAQTQKSAPVSSSYQDMLSPWQSKRMVIEEELSNLPSVEALHRTGISERAGFKEPYRGRTLEEPVLASISGRSQRIGLLMPVIQGSRLEQMQRTRQQSITDIMSGSMVISQTKIGQIQKADMMQDVLRDIAVVTGQNIRQEKITDTRQQQGVLIGFRQITDQTQKQFTETKITTKPDIIITTDIWRIPPPDIPKIPLGGLGFGGGGGGMFGDILRTHKRNYRNPVVDIEYLSGMYAAPAGMGRTPHKKGSSAPVRLLTGQLRSSAKHAPKKGKV